MKRKPLKRPVVSVNTSDQLPLLADWEAAVVKPPVDPSPRLPQAVQFQDPDPRAIRINEVRLDEHLKQVGHRAPLRIRALLQELCFAEFERAYRPGGRPPYAPRAMLGLILSGILQGITSLRDLERFARVDLGCWWVSGGILPDHSIIGRFIQRHAHVLTEGFFDQLVRQVLKVTGSGSAVVAGDGTIIEAAASRYRLVREEALREALTEAREALAAAPQERSRARRVAQFEQAHAVMQQRQRAREAAGKNAARVQINPQEPDARVQPLKDKKRFQASYKPSVLANEKRVVLAHGVHCSSETEPLGELLDRAQAHGEIETVLLDAGYFSDAVLEAAARRNIELLCPQGNSRGKDWNKQSEKYYPKGRFVYDPAHDAYRCPAGAHLTRVSQYRGSERYPGYVRYAGPACASCAQRPRCTRNSAGRHIKRYAGDGAKDALREKMAQPEQRARYVKRQGMVEPVFSQLRGRQGLNRFRRKGLKAVRLEFALHAMAYNLGRAMALGRLLSRRLHARLATLRHKDSPLQASTAWQPVLAA